MKFWIPATVFCLSTRFTLPVAYAMGTSESDSRDGSHLRHNIVAISAQSVSTRTRKEFSSVHESDHRDDVTSSHEGKAPFPVSHHVVPLRPDDDMSTITNHNETMAQEDLDISSSPHAPPGVLFDNYITTPVRSLVSASSGHVSEGADYEPCHTDRRWRIYAHDDDLNSSEIWSVCSLEFYSDSTCTTPVAMSGKSPKYFSSGPGGIKQQAPNAFDGDANTCWPGQWDNSNQQEYFLGYNQGLDDVYIKCMKIIQEPGLHAVNFKVQYQSGQWKDQFEINGVDASDTTIVLDSSQSTCGESPEPSTPPLQTSAPTSLLPETCSRYYFLETTGGGILADYLDQEYGSSVSISGDGQRIAVSGSVSNIFGPIQGLAQVFEYDGNSWNELGQTILTALVSVRVSAEVELSGDGTTLAFATVYNNDQDVSIGAVDIYKYNGINSQWEPRGNQITGGVAGNRAGLKVSLDDNGDIVAIGSRYYSTNSDQEVGRARVFEYDSVNNIWSQLGSDIVGGTASDHVGSAIALTPDGLHVAVGATGYDYFGGTNKIDAGFVRVYEYVASEWVKIGDDVIGEGEGDKSGFSVAIAKTSSLIRIAIGAIFNDGNGIDAGHARVYDFDSTQDIWVQTGSDIDGEKGLILDEQTFYYHVGDRAGFSLALSLDGSRVVIGSPYNNADSDYYGGETRIFDFDANTNTWNQFYVDIQGDDSFTMSGYSTDISKDGEWIVIGHPSTGFQGQSKMTVWREECLISDAPSSVPSISSQPSDTLSSHPSISTMPSGAPSVSVKPSSEPSLEPSLSSAPSMSAQPSGLPSLEPSVSKKPSTTPSVENSETPSLSKQPSQLPSSFPSVSIKPSTSLTPSISVKPSSLPSSEPSLSTKPSSTPSKELSSAPSVSVAPSVAGSSEPTLSLAPSVSVKPSTIPSSKPSLSTVPSVAPSVSVKPSTMPSSKPSLSSKPSTTPSDMLSSAPSVSVKPSTIPSSKPSLSTVPSVTPSVSVKPSTMPSSKPSLSSKPSTTPSDMLSSAPSVSVKPSTIPSSKPSLSTVPSVTPSVSVKPSTMPSSKPSLSSKPSTTPSDMLSSAPSVSVKPSTDPSSKPSLSSKPSVTPSVSVKPSTMPSSNPSLSSKPSTVPSDEHSSAPSVSMEPSLKPSQKPSTSSSPSSEPTSKPFSCNSVRFRTSFPMTSGGEDWCLSIDNYVPQSKIRMKRCIDVHEFKQVWSQLDDGKIRIGPSDCDAPRPYVNEEDGTLWPVTVNSLCMSSQGRKMFIEACDNATGWNGLILQSNNISMTRPLGGRVMDVGFDPLRRFSRLRLYYNEDLTNDSITSWIIDPVIYSESHPIAFPPSQ